MTLTSLKRPSHTSKCASIRRAMAERTDRSLEPKPRGVRQSSQRHARLRLKESCVAKRHRRHPNRQARTALAASPVSRKVRRSAHGYTSVEMRQCHRRHFERHRCPFLRRVCRKKRILCREKRQQCPFIGRGWHSERGGQGSELQVNPKGGMVGRGMLGIVQLWVDLPAWRRLDARPHAPANNAAC